MNFSIIIPVKKLNKFCKINIHHLRKIINANWELIIVTDNYTLNIFNDRRIKIIKSGSVPPGIKRDIGAKFASNEILVFLDDDSYPNPFILQKAKLFFNNKNLIGIGGPAITPLENSFLQKLFGATFAIGSAVDRYFVGSSIKKIDDWPSVNFMIRRDIFKFVNGFNTNFWPGEDTFIFFKLNKNFNGRIIYVPGIYVYHHRRKNLSDHLYQVSMYALHRGIFFRKFGKNSKKIIYIMPSLLLCFLIIYLVSEIFFSHIDFIYLLRLVFCIYLFFLIKSYINLKKNFSFAIKILFIPAVLLTHSTYGFYFLIGYLKKNKYGI